MADMGTTSLAFHKDRALRHSCGDTMSVMNRTISSSPCFDTVHVLKSLSSSLDTMMDSMVGMGDVVLT